ncbi:hypothetical protein PROFUN_15843 [Planoprotostelium fungivorum]|uniref:Uncharacterized protein n=1 Tax=Planoprotostelium fungivorum TaxID=1890364 RepID=A0A2P6MU95_9EUKA|nr:hypothetical protein PROFUN_15843 [Planoprotostelium fungivorum]
MSPLRRVRSVFGETPVVDLMIGLREPSSVVSIDGMNNTILVFIVVLDVRTTAVPSEAGMEDHSTEEITSRQTKILSANKRQDGTTMETLVLRETGQRPRISPVSQIREHKGQTTEATTREGVKGTKEAQLVTIGEVPQNRSPSSRTSQPSSNPDLDSHMALERFRYEMEDPAIECDVQSDVTYAEREDRNQPSSSSAAHRSFSTISVTDGTTSVTTDGLDGKPKSYTWRTPLTGLWKDETGRLYILSESRVYDACRIAILSIDPGEGLIAAEAGHYLLNAVRFVVGKVPHFQLIRMETRAGGTKTAERETKKRTIILSPTDAVDGIEMNQMRIDVDEYRNYCERWGSRLISLIKNSTLDSTLSGVYQSYFGLNHVAAVPCGEDKYIVAGVVELSQKVKNSPQEMEFDDCVIFIGTSHEGSTTSIRQLNAIRTRNVNKRSNIFGGKMPPQPDLMDWYNAVQDISRLLHLNLSFLLDEGDQEKAIHMLNQSPHLALQPLISKSPGLMPIMKAAQKGMIDTCKTMMHYKADIHAFRRGDNGREKSRSLEYAIVGKDVQMVRFLLDEGVKILSTTFRYAKEDKSMAKFLKRYQEEHPESIENETREDEC